MRFDLSKLRGLTPGQQAGVLEKAIKEGTRTSPDALRIAKQQGLGADEIAGLTNVQFSGRGHGQAGSECPGSPGPISKMHPIFRGLFGWASFDKSVASTNVVGGVQVPAEVPDRINARVALSSTPNSADPVLSEELEHTNGYGALLSAMFGPHERRSSVLLLPREKAVLPVDKVYASSAQLGEALRTVSTLYLRFAPLTGSKVSAAERGLRGPSHRGSLMPRRALS